MGIITLSQISITVARASTVLSETRGVCWDVESLLVELLKCLPCSYLWFEDFEAVFKRFDKVGEATVKGQLALSEFFMMGCGPDGGLALEKT